MFNNENSFQIPIEYLKKKHKVLQNLKNDLELEKNVNPENKPIYHYVFNPNWGVRDHDLIHFINHDFNLISLWE